MTGNFKILAKALPSGPQDTNLVDILRNVAYFICERSGVHRISYVCIVVGECNTSCIKMIVVVQFSVLIEPVSLSIKVLPWSITS